MSKEMSVEQMCRELLEKAIEDALVAPTNEFEDPDPQARSAGELVGVANLLSEWLGSTRVEARDPRSQEEQHGYRGRKTRLFPNGGPFPPYNRA